MHTVMIQINVAEACITLTVAVYKALVYNNIISIISPGVKPGLKAVGSLC